MRHAKKQTIEVRDAQRDLANGMSTIRAYDEVGRETGNYTSLGGDPLAATAARFTASYDAVGNMLSLVELAAATTFAYDRTNQLVNENRSGLVAHNTTHVYDPVGNRLSKSDDGALSTFLYDVANQIASDQTPDGSHDYAFDAMGNMTGQTTYDLAHVVTALSTLTYDCENRLIAQAGVTGPSQTQNFAYDGDGKRRQVTNGAKRTRFVWDGDNVLQDLDAGSPLLPLLAQYTDNPGYWGGLTSKRGVQPSDSRFDTRRFNAAKFDEAGGGMASRFYGFDMSANTRYLLDEAGDVSDAYVTDAFGQELYGSGSDSNGYRFGGQVGYRRDRMNTLYVRNRYYLAQLARWLTVDPLRFGGGLVDLFGYVGNEPNSLTDPSGLWPHDKYGHWVAQTDKYDFWYVGDAIRVQPPPGWVSSPDPSTAKNIGDINNDGAPDYLLAPPPAACDDSGKHCLPAGGVIPGAKYHGYNFVYGVFATTDYGGLGGGNLLVGYGPDVNNNGILDPEERRGWLAQCEKPAGVNFLFIADNRYIIWFNDAGGRGTDVTKFYFDTKTGFLEVRRLYIQVARFSRFVSASETSEFYANPNNYYDAKINPGYHWHDAPSIYSR